MTRRLSSKSPLVFLQTNGAPAPASAPSGKTSSSPSAGPKLSLAAKLTTLRQMAPHLYAEIEHLVDRFLRESQ
jgi:hypothetical protein